MEGSLLHDDQAERFVVGALLCSEECYYSVADRIKPGLFINPKLSRVVDIIIKLYSEGSNVNIITVSEYIISHPSPENPELFEIADYSTEAV